MKAFSTALILLSIHCSVAYSAPPRQLDKGRAQFSKGNYAAAAVEFFKAESQKDLLMGRFGFGLSLNRLKLPHLASIPMMTVATQGGGKLQKKALDSLVKISYDTNDNTLLNYSINKLSIEDLEETSQEIYYNRLAEYYHESGKYNDALKYIDVVLKKNPDNEKALHLGGLVYLKKNQPDKAAEFFKYLATFWETKAPNDETKGVALANYARALYQGRHLADAESVYRQIPKDHILYRKVQMELAWTLFLSGKIRSALSALQTLHTPYYENFYDPESFILRSIILIFACQGDEALKAVHSFEYNFKGLNSALSAWVERTPDMTSVLNEIQIAQEKLKDPKSEKKGSLPFFVVRTLMDEQPLNGLLRSKRDILKEQLLFQKTFKNVKNKKLATYAKKAYGARVRNINKNIARVFNHRMTTFLKDYRDLESQVEFLKYEILEEKKRASKAKMVETKTLDENEQRSFYVQNGYRYWPFTGEYWVDEIGNYQYLGVNRCEE